MGNSYHLMLVVIVMAAQFSDGQRVSIVERLKALDKGIRQGLQRQKSDAIASSPVSYVPSLSVSNPVITSPTQDEDQRQEIVVSDAPEPVAVNTLEPAEMGSKPVEQISQKTDQQQLSMSPEDADGTSDVVRQLTESYEEPEEVRKITPFIT